jgi:hypothetical protein
VLSTAGVDERAAIERARRLIGVAFDLLLEDEIELTKSGHGDEIFLGRWLTDRAGRERQSKDDLRERLQAVLEAILSSYFAHEQFVPEIVHVQALAGATRVNGKAVERTTLVPRDGAPRAQLLVPLLAALLSAEGRLPPLGAWGFSVHPGPTGEDADAYGVHKEPGRGPSERLLSLEVLGGDARAAVAMLNLVTGMRDAAEALEHDPVRRARAAEALAPYDIEPPSTPLEHLTILFRIISATRDLLDRAVARGSRELERAGIRATTMLDLGVPRWATLGPLAYGPQRDRGDLSAPRYWAGTDPAALSAARDRGILLLALAFDSATVDSGEVPGIDRLVLGGSSVSGRELAELLSSETRQQVLPTLNQLPPSQLRALEQHKLADRLEIRIDPGAVTAATLPSGHVFLSDRGGQPMPARLVLQSARSGADPAGTLAWTTNVDLSKSKAIDQAIVMSSLHRLALSPAPPLGGCSARMHRTFELHDIKTGKYATRCYLRVLAMLANLVLVGEGRSAQAESA